MPEQVIINSTGLSELLSDLAAKIAADAADAAAIALVGIRSRGEIIAQRLQKLLTQKHGLDSDLGALDITLYRDDLDQMGYKQPTVKTTEIDFPIDDRLIVLVDDVLNTGRSTRAALDALMDLGRPRAIRLAVLIDRGQRELPIRADYVGQTTQTPREQRICVYLREVDDREEITIA